MKFVLDASVTLGWCYDDESQQLTSHVNDLLENGHTALAPVIWWFEVRNAVTMGLRRQRITADHSRKFLARLGDIPMAIAPLPNEGEVLELARRHRLTFYDAAYLELAQREGLPLATLDSALAAAAKAEDIALIGA